MLAQELDYLDFDIWAATNQVNDLNKLPNLSGLSFPICIMVIILPPLGCCEDYVRMLKPVPNT